jgi:hypothetical protein
MTTTNDTPTRYYIVETEYEGPNTNDHIDDHTYAIQTEPARGNMDHQPVLDGWAGTTNDWAVRAHGAYDTLDEAREALFALIPEHREDDVRHEHDCVVEQYRPGSLVPWRPEGTGDWAAEGFDADITADTTDEEIEDLCAQYESDARQSFGAVLHARALRQDARSVRDRKRGEVEAGC